MQFVYVNNVRMVDPLQWGWAFARKHWGLLIQLALLPALFDAASAYLEFSQPLSRRDVFLIQVLSLLVNTWLVQAALGICVEYLRQGEAPSILSLYLQGWLSLPKLFFSYVTVAVLIVLLLGLPPLLLLGVFFLVWAPLFCAGELYTEPAAVRQEEDNAILEDVWMDHEPGMRPAPQRRFFSAMPVWNLGLLRSVELAKSYPLATLSIVVLLWFSHVVPLAMMESFGEASQNVYFLLGEVCLSTIFESFALGVAAAVFLTIVPAQAKLELGIGDEGEHRRRFEALCSPCIVQHKGLFVTIMIIAASLCSAVIFEKLQISLQFPDSVKTELLAVETSTGRLAFEVRLTDDLFKFRWLDFDSFRISFAPPVGVKPEQAKEKVGTELSGGDSAPSDSEQKNQLLKFDRIVVYDLEGNLLNRDAFAPYDRPLIVKFSVALPQEKNDDKQEFFLYYEPLKGDSRLVLRGNDW